MARESSARTRVVMAAGIAGLAIVLVAWLAWPSKPPQMGADEEVFTAVDALFTAVTAQDEKLLNQCEQRLHTLRDAGKLPDDAADYLDGIIEKARAGRWQSAAERLYTFMKAQRREGASESSHKKPRR